MDKKFRQSFLQVGILLFFLTFFWQTRINLFSFYEVYDYLIPFVYLSDILILILLACEFVKRPGWLLEAASRDKVWSIACILFFVLILFTAITALYPGSAIYKVLKLGLFFIFALWISELVRYKPWTDLLRWLSLGAVPLVIIGILEVLRGESLGLQFLGEWQFSFAHINVAKTRLFGYVLMRPYSTFPHPNVLGGSMAFLAAALTPQVLKEQPKERMWMYVWIVMCVGLIFSFSRSAWIGFLIAAAWVYFNQKLSQMRKINGKKLFVLVVFIGIAALLVYQSLKLWNEDYLSFSRRERLNEIAMQLYGAFPWFGVGLSQFILHLDKIWVSDLPRFIQPVHNVPLLVLVETGTLGAILLCMLFFRPIWRAWWRLELSIQAGWLVIFCTSLFDHYWWTLQAGQLLLFLTLGLTLATIKSN